jgi:hypothetical protein
MALAQESLPQNVMLGSSNSLRRGICEPSISINPKDPSNLVAGTILNQVFYSVDSGRSWLQDTLKSSYGVWGDPVVLSDTAGHHYYLHLSDPTGENWMSAEILDRIVCQKSTDGGKTWNNGSFMGLAHPKDQDKHWAAVDPETNTIYVTWTQFDKYGAKDPSKRSNILFSKSNTAGESWSEAKVISEVSGNCLDGDSTTEGAVPAVGPDGTLYVTWANQGKLFFDRSEDGGETWLDHDLVIAEQPGGWDIDIPGLYRANGMPVTVADHSPGPYRGSIYVNWVDDRNGHYDVWLMRSSDKGNTWSAHIKLNDDDTQRDQFFSALSCDPVTGHLYAVFYDRREHDDLQTEVYLARSTDGGVTWQNQKISERPFVPNPEIFFGDYNDIDAYNGVVRPIWTRLDGFEMSVWTALINFDQHQEK